MEADLSPAVVRDMEKKRIDRELTLSILRRFNEGRFDNAEPVRVTAIPGVDGNRVLDMTGSVSLRIDAETARRRLSGLGIDPDRIAPTRTGGNLQEWDAAALGKLGVFLYPLLSYGILNGGSATSYADIKKNQAFSSDLFALLRENFESIADVSRGRPKGLTPGFINPDGSAGPSFLELKMRALLVQALAFRSITGREGSPASARGEAAASPGDGPQPLFPLFQMTSILTDREVREAFDAYRESPFLRDLIAATGIDITRAESAVQPLIAAYTPSAEGRPKRVFTEAFGRQESTLPLPGGHGQNFLVLRDIYRGLRESGKRFVYLTNVDNLGSTVDPVALAYLALSGKQAGFDFAFRTPVDVKGGILVRDQRGRFNCADIGPAVSREEVLEAEQGGSEILFNCATGLFDLDYLAANLDRIIDELPTRFSDQDKDAGRYSQAEQVTWEVIGMLDDFLVFGVNKYDRFLAAKLLMETMMTSGVLSGRQGYPSGEDPQQDLRALAGKLHEGLVRKLTDEYALRLEGGKWAPVPAEEIAARFEG